MEDLIMITGIPDKVESNKLRNDLIGIIESYNAKKICENDGDGHLEEFYQIPGTGDIIIHTADSMKISVSGLITSKESGNDIKYGGKKELFSKNANAIIFMLNFNTNEYRKKIVSDISMLSVKYRGYFT